MLHFHDRREAGAQLAERLQFLKGRDDLIVLGIPRGGVVVADEIALALDAPLDVFITHKIGAPFNPELAIGAVAGDGTTFLDSQLIAELGLGAQEVERARSAQLREIQRRADLYRRGQPAYEFANKTVVLTDDGVATGATTVAALRALVGHHPAQRVLAVPVAPHQVAPTLAQECDRLVLIATPAPFLAVGRFYQEFEQVSDEEVMRILNAARTRMARRAQA